jgi:hypothetical protein
MEQSCTKSVPIAVNWETCQHVTGTAHIKTYNTGTTVETIISDHHPPGKLHEVKCFASMNAKQYDIQTSMTVRDLSQMGLSALKLVCQSEVKQCDPQLQKVVEKTNDAFSRLMAGRQIYTPSKTKR